MVLPGVGTLVNVLAVLVGASVGALAGHRLGQHTRDVVTDALGLVTLLIGALGAAAVTDAALGASVGDSAPVLVVLGSLVLGGALGSSIGVEAGLERLGQRLRRTLTRSGGHDPRFVEGFVTSSLVFCVGPLTVLGSLSEGLGRGADQLLLKSALDGFAAIAFAASFGWGVAASALTVLVVQGTLTAVGAVLGDVLPEAYVAALEATGGLLLLGVGINLLRLRSPAVPVGDLLPALLVVPLLTGLAAAVR